MANWLIKKLELLSWIPRIVGATARLFRRLPWAELWLWPLLEVIFIASFSIMPLLMVAATTALRSEEPVYFVTAINDLLSRGQLMYYALGFVATSAWLLLVDIRRPKLIVPILGFFVFVVVIGVALTIGTDPNAANFNRNAFREASYWVFGGSLFTYAVTIVLRAWQPSLSVEKRNRSDAGKFVDQLRGEIGK